MATILVGKAAVGAVAAKAGLFGTAGSFALPQAIATVGTGVAAAGAIASGRAQQAQFEAQENLAKFNAAVRERQAEAERQRSLFASKRQAKRAERIRSAQTVALATGPGLGSPVAADLVAEQEAELELENLLIGFEGRVRAGRAEAAGQRFRGRSEIARRRGTTARTAGRIRAGTTLLRGFGRTFS